MVKHNTVTGATGGIMLPPQNVKTSHQSHGRKLLHETLLGIGHLRQANIPPNKLIIGLKSFAHGSAPLGFQRNAANVLGMRLLSCKVKHGIVRQQGPPQPCSKDLSFESTNFPSHLFLFCFSHSESIWPKAPDWWSRWATGGLLRNKQRFSHLPL